MGCSEVEGVVLGCSEVEGVVLGCSEVEGVVLGCSEVEGVVLGCRTRWVYGAVGTLKKLFYKAALADKVKCKVVLE